MIITLTTMEAVTPAFVGTRRQMAAMQAGLIDKNGSTADGFAAHIFGAIAEFAVARALNMFWAPSVGVLNHPDVGLVGKSVEVRLVRLRHAKADSLIMYQKDRNEDRFVLVWNRFDTLEFELIGWLYGAEAKAAGIWLADHGFWIVRPPYRPIDDLLQK